MIRPFKFKDSGNENIPFEPKSCIEYLPPIILKISDDKSSKGMSNLRFSIHVKRAIQFIHENYKDSFRI